LLHNNGQPIEITFYITSYTGLFLNLIICNIIDTTVHMSYVLRLKNYNYVSDKKNYTIDITHVGCTGKFDNGSIPELDYFILNNI
jgi:hypothetical protein